MISFFVWAEDMIFKDDYYTQLRTATRRSKSPVDFMEYGTVATKWKSIADLSHAEEEAAKKATAAAAEEPEAALGAAGSADDALARPKNSCDNDDAAAADDTAVKREAETRPSSPSPTAALI